MRQPLQSVASVGYRQEVSRVIRSATKGFLAGALATAPMSAAFAVAQLIGTIGELPPRKAIRAVSPQLREPQRTRAAAVAHVLVGAVAGTAYGAVVPRPARGTLSGIAAGLVVWLVGYEVVMPAATGMPRVQHDDRRRAVTILLAHVVYGATLGSIVAIEHRRPSLPGH
jgi:hypothetical protein